MGKRWIGVIGGLIVLLYLALVGRPTALASASSNWRTYLYNAARTGYNRNETILTPTTTPNLTLKWQDNAGGSTPSIFTQPLVVDSRIYWGAFDGYERATDRNGGSLWQTFIGQTSDTNCSPPVAGVSSTGTLAQMTVGAATSVLFVGGGDAHFYALDASNGNILWSTKLGSTPSHYLWGSPAVYGGSVYIGMSSFGDCPLVRSTFYKLSAQTGKIQAVFYTVPQGCRGASIWSSPAIDTAAGTLYFSTGNPGACSSAEPYANALVELKLSNLALVGAWQVPASQSFFDSDFGATPTIFNAVTPTGTIRAVGLINKNGIYYALRRDALRNGPIWQDQLGRAGGCTNCHANHFSPSAWDGKRLYIGSGETIINGNRCQGSLQMVNPANGKIGWQLCLDGPVIGAVTAAPGLVAVTEGNTILVVAADTGQTLYSYTGPGFFWGPVTISNGMLFVGDTAGNFLAFGL